MGTLTPRGSSSYPGGFYALGGYEKLDVASKCTVNEPYGKNQIVHGCSSVRSCLFSWLVLLILCCGKAA